MIALRKTLLLLAFVLTTAVPQAFADVVQGSTTPPNKGIPEYLYQMTSGNGFICGKTTAPTQTEKNYGLFAFYKAENKGNETYYIYSYKEQKWLTYNKAASYTSNKNFIKLNATQDTACYFLVHAYSGEKYEIQPYSTKGVSNQYLNWFGGVGSGKNEYDGSNTLGIWTDKGSKDGGSRWTFSRVIVKQYTYTVNCDDGVTVNYGGKQYKNGETISTTGTLNTGAVSVTSTTGKFATVVARLNSETTGTVTVAYHNTPSTPVAKTYTTATLYPEQQEEVGDAWLQTAIEDADTVYTLSNNVLSAAFVKTSGALFFGGSKAMNLEAGTEPFTVAFGSGDVVAASAMTLKDIKEEDLTGNSEAVGGAEHYNGKALVANYEYAYGDSVINIEWRAVLRDGSHYLRTEMKLTGKNDIDMYNVIPLIYNVNAKEAGSTPAVVGNTRGAVVMNDKIFAGLENPVGYNTVGDATGDEDNWEVDQTLSDVSLAASDWKDLSSADEVPTRVQEVSGYTYPNVKAYTSPSTYHFAKNQKVQVTVTYTGGANRLNLDGAELLLNGSSAASDFHFGFTGNAKENNVYTMVVAEEGDYTLRMYIDKRESITATSKLSVVTYKAKEGVVINTDVVPVKGRWSRNTTLQKGDTWKISGVVGLIAQDGKQSETDITKTQKRRSFLAYSERERAVPWRAFPAYISWYELNINRNNAEDPTQNMNAEQVLDVERHWLTNSYNRYKVGPKAFVIDDGWDNYGLWTFHAGFPNEMRDIADSAKTMQAGVGAWLGPVGGYGTSGDYRRSYWNSNNRGGMHLSNPAYYKVFLNAARNLTKNQGDFRFFKFDGISAQFSAVGPDAGDAGNENAEGIIKLEQFVRDSLRRDIFFNTTVGTWASPFWYHITDATWRQANDYGESANSNTIDRERWITYRDQLVYQNYVTNSPICPINTLMTHGFILTKFGSVSKNMEYNNVLRELRAAFVCGSGMVELYNDYSLMNSINHGALWADLAECIKWQQRNADVLPDAHWVGGNPWNGSVTAVYGWASWNGKKATLALRNGGNDTKTYSFTLRDALNIPATVTGATVTFSKSFGVQDSLQGFTELQPIGIDDKLTVTLPGSSLFCFDGVCTDPVKVTNITIKGEDDSTHVAINKTLVLTGTTNTDASFPALLWESSDTTIAKVVNGLVVPVKEGEVTITAKATDGSGVSQSVTVKVTPKPFEPYACNFDKSESGTRTNRWITSVTLTPKGQPTQTLTVGTANKPYVDLVDSVLTCNAGDSLTVVINKNANWMNGYVYIDVNQDSIFQFRPDTLDQTGTDVMSYSFYSANFSNDKSGQNSAGKQLTNNARNTMYCPPFLAPTKAGTYRIRFKMDWNSIDPGGQLAADGTLTGSNGFFANSGEIVDATLLVKSAPTGITKVETDANRPDMIYDLQGRRLSEAPSRGVYIINGKKVIK